MTTEVWKPVPGWPYSASSLGRVMRSGGPTTNTYTGKILKPILQKRTGYHHVCLYRNGKQKQWRLGVLIAKLFLGAARGREVNHKDTVKTHDWLENLEYLTHSQHEKHTTANGLRPIGKNHWKGKVTHCLQGHEYSAENTYRYPDGRRDCRICIRKAGEKYRNRRKHERQRIKNQGSQGEPAQIRH